MTHRPIGFIALLLIAAAAISAAEKPPAITFPLHDPNGVYWQGEGVVLGTSIAGGSPGEVDLDLVIRDYRQGEVLRRSQRAILAEGSQSLAWDLGQLDDGYYEATLTAAGATAKTAFAVAPRITRSAAEVREGGFRIGLKMWYLGPAWWRGNAEWDERAAVAATTGLGLQWTRALLQQTSHLDTVDLVTHYPMNAVLKVERFPASCYDEERYGPMAEWEAVNGKGVWGLKTLPRKEPYQAWLREQVARLPADQQVFEVWNEAWDKMSPEDLATLCIWISEAIHADRPQALIGPNLMGVTSRYGYDARVIDAGGMANMQMVCLHPYGSSENRAWMRDYQAWLRERLGRDVPIYVTEYGSHSCPEGPSQRSELDQARSVVTQTLCLYAEGVVAMTPHWMGQREENPTYHEDWFGYFRLDQTPKPCLVALAACARRIDGSRYLGDLWFGPGVGAMVFEKPEERCLVLYTKEGTRTLTIDEPAQDLRLIDMVGRTHDLVRSEGKVTVEVGPDPVYLVGIGDALAAQASTELRPERWADLRVEPERAVRHMPRVATLPVIDGEVKDWEGRLQISLVNPKVNGDDASGLAGVAWDERFLYLAIKARDNQILNTRPIPKVYQQDSLEIFLGSEVRDQDAGYGPTDRQFWMAPTTVDGVPLFARVAERSSGGLASIPGVAFAAVIAKPGWSAEAAIPWEALGIVPEVGRRIALDLRLNDADTSHERWKVDPEDSRIDTENPTRWAVMVLDGLPETK